MGFACGEQQFANADRCIESARRFFPPLATTERGEGSRACTPKPWRRRERGAGLVD